MFLLIFLFVYGYRRNTSTACEIFEWYMTQLQFQLTKVY